MENDAATEPAPAPEPPAGPPPEGAGDLITQRVAATAGTVAAAASVVPASAPDGAPAEQHNLRGGDAGGGTSAAAPAYPDPETESAPAAQGPPKGVSHLQVLKPYREGYTPGMLGTAAGRGNTDPVAAAAPPHAPTSLPAAAGPPGEPGSLSVTVPVHAMETNRSNNKRLWDSQWTDEVLDMDVRTLNKYLKDSGMNEEEKHELKEARRRRNNRVYAKRSREKRLARKRSDMVQQQNKDSHSALIDRIERLTEANHELRAREEMYKAQIQQLTYGYTVPSQPPPSPQYGPPAGAMPAGAMPYGMPHPMNEQPTYAPGPPHAYAARLPHAYGTRPPQAAQLAGEQYGGYEQFGRYAGVQVQPAVQPAMQPVMQPAVQPTMQPTMQPMYAPAGHALAMGQQMPQRIPGPGMIGSTSCPAPAHGMIPGYGIPQGAGGYGPPPPQGGMGMDPPGMVGYGPPNEAATMVPAGPPGDQDAAGALVMVPPSTMPGGDAPHGSLHSPAPEAEPNRDPRPD